MTLRIVVHSPVALDGVLASKVLNSVGIEVCVCRDMERVLEELAAGVGALMVVEEGIAGLNVQHLRRFIESQPPWSDLPVIVLTARGSDSLVAQRAVELLGNVTLLERPVRTIALISAARSALRARERQYQVRVADQRKDEFLAMLAHELRNPLAPIRNSMAIISRLQPTREVQGLAGVVERQVGHLTRLVDDLLDVARITTGKIVLQKQPTSVDAVVTHALEIAGSGIREKSHELQVEKPEVDHALLADHARVVQSVANLLVNAAKFTPAHGRLALRVEVEGDTVVFHVKDNGRGLAPESITSIFEMFAQARAPGEPTSGLGIGLNLAKRFAEMHGGDVHVVSDGVDQGSEFILRLPVVMQASPAAQVQSKSSAPVQAKPGAEPRAAPTSTRVLVVDDNVDAAHTLGELLGMEGFEVTLAFDGVEAVEATLREQPAIVLMDIGMPRMNGYEAAKLIREKDRDVKLYALTGWGQELDRQAANEAGFDSHFVKPVDLQALLTRLSAR